MAHRLYTYFRSSAAYRVRIALNLKGVAYESIPVHLVRGEQRDDAYLALNPSGLVPAFVPEGGALIGQSLAIIEYLEETHPHPELLPKAPAQRAGVRAAALSIACDIHPLNNTRVIGYLKSAYGADTDGTIDWMRHWMALGLAAYEKMIAPEGNFSFGDNPTLADLCLIPQLYNAKRWSLDLSALPRLTAIYDHALDHPAFASAAPESQPDTE